ncbi:PIN domain-containing protein [Neolewinella antarctica]|uniref:DUF4935 domain-containing protein n=1 Tax=Neolewinella antarctica TaxID=442734 RepID=A0ABX0XGA9_9BACT|nr:PIN domain-containing protein [Neolewinella antarctica]NJC28190.1 hypothetical protein [Neolewinella antarctica]
MLNLLIDSTHYKNDIGFNKSDLVKIRSLGHRGYLILHIPHIVYNECISHLKSTLNSSLNSSFGKVAGLSRQGLHHDEHVLAKDAADAIHALKQVVEASAVKSWAKFIEESKSILYELNTEDTQEIFDAYFSAGKPFKSLKHRDDIPDAYIYYQARKIAENCNLTILSGDKNLRDKLNELENIRAYETWDEIYETSIYKEAAANLEENKIIDDKREILIDELPDIIEEVRLQISKMEDIRFFNDIDDVDERETTIQLFENVKVSIDEEIEFYGEGFVIPFCVVAEAQVEYYMYWGDYAVADFRNLYDSEAINKHVIRIVEGWTIKTEIDYLILLEEVIEGGITLTVENIDEWKIID